MKRRDCIKAVGSLLLAGTVRTAGSQVSRATNANTNGRDNAYYTELVRACRECEKACRACVSFMPSLINSTKAEHQKATYTKTMHMVEDCADYAALGAKMAARKAPLLTGLTTGALFTSCGLCAAACHTEDSDHKKPMFDCYRACRDCWLACKGIRRAV